MIKTEENSKFVDWTQVLIGKIDEETLRIFLFDMFKYEIIIDCSTIECEYGMKKMDSLVFGKWSVYTMGRGTIHWFFVETEIDAVAVKLAL
jgi:hypothetical protein